MTINFIAYWFFVLLLLLRLYSLLLMLLLLSSCRHLSSSIVSSKWYRFVLRNRWFDGRQEHWDNITEKWKMKKGNKKSYTATMWCSCKLYLLNMMVICYSFSCCCCFFICSPQTTFHIEWTWKRSICQADRALHVHGSVWCSVASPFHCISSAIIWWTRISGTNNLIWNNKYPWP